MKNININGIDKATWVRMIGLLVVLVNQVAVSVFNFQLIPFEDAEVYNGVSNVLTILMAVTAGWKNNSITAKAQFADEIMKEVK